MRLRTVENLLATKPSTSGAMVLGATAAVVSANLMTVFRMIARRFGYIDKTVPQAMQDWALAKTGIEMPGGAVSEHVVDQVLHMSYATGLGALDAALYEKNFKNTYARGILLGAASWAFAGFVLLPALGVSKSATKAKPAENLVNLSAHLLFGLGTAILTEEFIHQPARGPSSKQERLITQVG